MTLINTVEETLETSAKIIFSIQLLNIIKFIENKT